MDLDTQKITFASSDEIGKYDKLAEDVLRRIFKLEFSETLITDESWLSDISGCCVPDSESIEDLSLSEFTKIGDRVMIEQFKELYGVDVTAHDPLVDVFKKITESYGTV